MKVLIAGAGIGGLAAALSLHHVGIAVEVFERAPTLAEAGAGIQISPNGARVLHALGLEQALAEIAFRPEAIEFRLHKSGLTVAHLALGDSAVRRYGFPYYHIHRADLHRVLEAAVRERCGDVISLGRDVDRFEQTPSQVELVFGDGARRAADALVGCDGIHSKIREGLLGPEQPEFTGHVAWRGVVPAAQLEHAGVRPVATSWMAPHSHAVTYYLRRGELVNFVGVTEHASWRDESWTARGDKAELVGDFRDWHPTIRAVVAEIDEPFRWALFARKPLTKWSEGRITLLGDACHPMLPYLAQGANMAIEDGYVLAQCLNASRADVSIALQRYESLRLARTARVQAGARANGNLFHLANPLARVLTYGTLALGSRLTPALAARRNDWLMSYDATAQVAAPGA